MIKRLLWGIGICIAVVALMVGTIAIITTFNNMLLVEVARYTVKSEKVYLNFDDASLKIVYTDEDELVILENARVKDISNKQLDIKETEETLSVTWTGEYKIHGFSFTYHSQIWLPLLIFKEYEEYQHKSDMLRYVDYIIYLPRGIETEILCLGIVDADGYEEDFNQYTNITVQ